MQQFDFTKYSIMLEGIRNAVTEMVVPLLDEEDHCDECGPDCDCEECQAKYHKGEEDECSDSMGESKNWIQNAIKRPGALHKSLGVKKDKKIPAKKLAKASHSKNPTTRKRANLAKVLKGFHKR